jgi:serine phosphatase RsbU (regulator of sigma subunit)
MAPPRRASSGAGRPVEVGRGCATAGATLGIAPGTLVCFYTDGLIERRGHPIDHGLARLCQAVTAQPPDAACAEVMAAPVGAEPAHDDIALFMFRRQPPGTR